MIRSGHHATDISRTLAAAAIIGIAGLTGCSATPPSFSVVDVGVTSESQEATVVTFVLQGDNTWTDPLPLRDVIYSVSLDGQTVFSGRRSAEVTLPAGGSQQVRLPVPIPADRRVEPGSTIPYRLSATVEYVLPGSIAEALFDSGLRVPTVGFGESGNLEFPAVGPATSG